MPIEEECYWLSGRDKGAAVQSFSGNHNADIAVIGAGFTGLWTAYFLKELNPELELVVLEMGVAGYGGSGRNAGIVSNCIDHSHALAIKHFGFEEAKRLAAIGLKNIDELAEFSVDCDFQRSGQLQIALNESHIEGLSEQIELAGSLGIEGYKLLSRDEVQNELQSPLFLAAAFVPGGGIINPVKLVDRLKKTLESKGVKIFERSKVSSVKGATVELAAGELRAKRVLLATDSYSHHLFPQLLARFIPLYDYIMVSSVLTDEQMSAIGWKQRQSVVDCRNFFNYYRLTADNRILWGTSEAKYFPVNRVDESCDHSQEHYDSLKESFLRHFPQLSELEFEYRWGGPIASTTRLTPFFGTLEAGKVIYGLGYTGHGIGSTRVAGRILAHMALEKNSELLELALVKQKPFPYPPEPLRGISVNLVSSSLRAVDKGKQPNMLLKMLDLLNIGFSS